MRGATLIMAILTAALAAVYAAGTFSAEGTPRASRVAKPQFGAAQGEACVAPVEEMRRNHMKMLSHQRDRTVHDGLRPARESLKGCIDCHADRKTGSVLGEKGFCSSCHAYAAVKLDCFECHTPLRQKAQAAVQPAVQPATQPAAKP